MNYCASQRKWPVLDYLFLNRKYKKWCKKHRKDAVTYGDVEPGIAYWPGVDFPILEDPNDMDADGIYPAPFSELHPFPLQCRLKGGGREKGKEGKRVNRRKKNNNNRTTRKTGNYIVPSAKSKDIAPPTRYVELTHNDPNTVIQAASPFQIVTYQFTSAYDVSSGILTTGYAGFEENSAFYDENQVYKTEATWVVANNETSTQLRVGMIPTCYDANANIVSFQEAVDLMEGPFSTGLVMLERASGGPAVHTFKMTIFPKQILGNNKYFTDSKYSGTFNSSPSVMLYLNLVVVSLSSATNLTNGVTGNFSMRSLIRFWNFRKIVDPAPERPKIKSIPLSKKKGECDSASDSEEIVVVSSRKRDKKKIS